MSKNTEATDLRKITRDSYHGNAIPNPQTSNGGSPPCSALHSKHPEPGAQSRSQIEGLVSSADALLRSSKPHQQPGTKINTEIEDPVSPPDALIRWPEPLRLATHRPLETSWRSRRTIPNLGACKPGARPPKQRNHLPAPAPNFVAEGKSFGKPIMRFESELSLILEGHKDPEQQPRERFPEQA